MEKPSSTSKLLEAEAKGRDTTEVIQRQGVNGQTLVMYFTSCAGLSMKSRLRIILSSGAYHPCFLLNGHRVFVSPGVGLLVLNGVSHEGLWYGGMRWPRVGLAVILAPRGPIGKLW